MPPKSFKADGTPKQRWSASDRKTKGHAPRRSGGQPRGRAGDNSPRTRQDGTTATYADRRVERSERPDRPVSGERPAGADRTSRPVRTEWAGRDDRRSGGGPTERRDQPPRSRDDRPMRSRDDRPSWNRDDRSARSGGGPTDRRRDDQSPRFRDDRPSWNRDDRPARSGGGPTDRGRDDRPGWRRDDRPARTRDDRPSRDRDDRPSRGQSARIDRSAPFDTWSTDHRPPKRHTPPDRAERPSRAARETKRFDQPRERFEPPVSTARVDEVADQPVRTDPIEVPAATSGTFAELGLPASLVSALRAGGITAPFPIQTATIPDALKGRDVLGRGQTGSGKTLAFGLPMVATLAGSASSVPRAIVLVPTRELAMQVTDVLTPLARTAGLSTVLIAGGMSYTPQLKAFERGVDIVVATPGRLIDLMNSNVVDLTRIEITVLDEADHMADLGFMPDVTTIMDTVPAGGQRMLFSATLDQAINRLVGTYLVDPVTHEVDSGQASVTTMAHYLLHVAPKDKAQVTVEVAGRTGRTVIFVRTQRGADRVAEQLRAGGVLAGALHGGLAQGARTRILAIFKEGLLPVLVATDVAARGIHVDDISLVLQVDPPGGPKEYLHRAGRTARAGGIGTVATLVLPHQRRELSRLTGQAGVRPIELPAEPGGARLTEVTGAQLTPTAEITEGEYQRLIAPPPARRRSAADRPWGKSGGNKGRSRADDRGRGDRPQRSSRRDNAR